MLQSQKMKFLVLWRYVHSYPLTTLLLFTFLSFAIKLTLNSDKNYKTTAQLNKYNVMKSGGGGGTAIYGLCRYVPL